MPSSVRFLASFIVVYFLAETTIDSIVMREFVLMDWLSTPRYILGVQVLGMITLQSFFLKLLVSSSCEVCYDSNVFFLQIFSPTSFEFHKARAWEHCSHYVLNIFEEFNSHASTRWSLVDVQKHQLVHFLMANFVEGALRIQ
jgi:hypothetical protein